MQQLGLKSPVRLKKYRSYRGNMGLAAENILQRLFKAAAPCEKWVTDTEAQHSAAVGAALLKGRNRCSTVIKDGITG